MRDKSLVGKALQPAVESREQIFVIFRNLKWMVLLSAAISAFLYLSDQARELYRISASDGGWIAAKEFLAIGAIALVFWFGAFQVTLATSQDVR